MSNPRPVPFATTLHVRDHCLCLATQRAARALARRFDAALRPLDINNGQFSLLMALNRPHPPGVSSVAALLAMDRTTLTAALKPLERRGLVQSQADPRDRRSRLLALTQDGQDLLARAVPIWRHEHGMLDAEVGDDAIAALRGGLASAAGPLPSTPLPVDATS